MWLSKGRRFQAEATASANSQAGSWLAHSRACEETGVAGVLCATGSREAGSVREQGRVLEDLVHHSWPVLRAAWVVMPGLSVFQRLD